MIFYLIKNNLKLMMRNKWIIVLMILGPIITTAILSNAFQELMKSYDGSKEFTVGYRISSESPFANEIEMIKSEAKKADMTLVECLDGSPETVMKQNNLAAFVDFQSADYTLYQSEDFVVEGMTLEYFMSKVVKTGLSQAAGSNLESEQITLPVKKLKHMPAIDSKDYYSIVYIIYFIWCGIVCSASVFSNEKKYGIDKKFQVSNLSSAQLFASKWIPAVLAIAIEMLVTIVCITLFFDVHWGNVPMTILVILGTIMAATSFSILIYYLVRNLAVTIIAVFTIVWFLAFFGGCFETYMFSSWPEWVKRLSPIYHTNRTLVEYSCMGSSSYTSSCFIYLGVLIIGCTILAVFVDTIKRRGRR